jgi:hypothetical protein
MFLFALAALALGVGTPLVTAWMMGRRPFDGWLGHLQVLETLLTVVAFFLAAGWYFVERPSNPKVKVEQTATGAPLGDGRVLVVVELALTNVGETAVEFRQAPLTLFVQQVTPLPHAVDQEAQPPPGAAPAIATLHPADNWSLLAALPDPAQPAKGGAPGGFAPIDSFLEAQETENLYYRVILPCKPGLRIYLTSRFSKPQSLLERWQGRRLSWIKQTYLDLSTQCAAKEQGK